MIAEFSPLQIEKLRNSTAQHVAEGIADVQTETLAKIFEWLADMEKPVELLGPEVLTTIRLFALPGILAEMHRRREVAELEG